MVCPLFGAMTRLDLYRTMLRAPELELVQKCRRDSGRLVDGPKPVKASRRAWRKSQVSRGLTSGLR